VTHFADGLAQCRNCGAELEGKYCGNCGQKVAALNPSLRDLLHDLTHEFLHLDGKIFRTTRLLLTRPGFLTREYFQGRRARYVSPIRLYLVFSVIFFATSALIDTEPVFRPEDEVEAGPLGRLLGLENLPAERANELANEASTHWMPRAMFLLVPLCAGLIHLVTRKTGQHYPQHLYFTIHIHAAYFAVLTAVTVVGTSPSPFVRGLVSVVPALFAVLYSLLAFRTAYGGTWGLAAGRLAFVLPAYMLAVMMAIVGVAVLVARM
jgi:hypothetical protein